MLGEIDLNNMPKTPSFFLAKPNGQILGKMLESYSVNRKFKFNGLNEMTMTLPMEVDDDGTLIRNPHIALLKSRYLVKVIESDGSDKIEWYRIESITDELPESGQAVTKVQLYSLAIELKDRTVRAYVRYSISPERAIREAIGDAGGYIEFVPPIGSESSKFYTPFTIAAETRWKVGFIDPVFTTLGSIPYRTLEIDNKTVLDFLFEIATTYNGILVFDTINRTVSLRNPTYYHEKKSNLKISYHNYLKSLNKEEDSGNIATRLSIYGKDGMSIQRLNPSGQSYIEDFSFFMYPFQRDESTRDIIKSSDYMSDELCHALLDYKYHLEGSPLIPEDTGYQGVFSDLLTSLTAAQQAQTQSLNAAKNAKIKYESIKSVWEAAKMHQSTGGTFGGGYASPYYYAGNNLFNFVVGSLDSGSMATTDFGSLFLRAPNSGHAAFVTSSPVDLRDTLSISAEYTFSGGPNAGFYLVASTSMGGNHTVYDAMNSTILDPVSNPLSIDVSTLPETSLGRKDYYLRIHSVADATEPAEVRVHSIVGRKGIGGLANETQELELAYSAAKAQSDADALALVGLQDDLYDLRVSLVAKYDELFPSLLRDELTQYIIEKEWTDENYIDDEELYEVGKEKMAEIARPPLVLNMNIVNFKALVTEQYNWDKLELGDNVIVYYDKFDINVIAKVIETNFDYGTDNISVTISDAKALLSDEDKFIQMLYQGASTSTTVDFNKFKWDIGQQASNDVTNLMTHVWSTTRQAIDSGINNDVVIDNRGITITNPDDPNNMIRVVSGAIGLSSDAGASFNAAITPQGIIANRLMGEILIGNRLMLESGGEGYVGNATFQFDEDGAVLRNTTFSAEKVILNGGDPGYHLANVITINPDQGIEITQYKQYESIENPGTGTKQLFLDIEGNINFAGHLEGASGRFMENIEIGGAEPNVNQTFKADAEGIYLGNQDFTLAHFRVNMSGELVATNATISGNINMSGGSINWATVNAPPGEEVVLPDYIKSTYIDFSSVNTPNLRGGTIVVGGVHAGWDQDHIFRLTQDGLHLGHDLFADAPFSVDMDGNLIATEAFITGTVQGSDIIGGTLKTNLTGQRIEINASPNDIDLYDEAGLISAKIDYYNDNYGFPGLAATSGLRLQTYNDHVIKLDSAGDMSISTANALGQVDPETGTPYARGVLYIYSRLWVENDILVGGDWENPETSPPAELGNVLQDLDDRVQVWVEPEPPAEAKGKDVWIDTDDYSRYDVLTLSSNRILEASDDEVIVCIGNITITLHDPTSPGIIKKIYNRGSGLVVVVGDINGGSSLMLYPNESVSLVSAGSDWRW